MDRIHMSTLKKKLACYHYPNWTNYLDFRLKAKPNPNIYSNARIYFIHLFIFAKVSNKSEI